jgi:hypothetical protein
VLERVAGAEKVRQEAVLGYKVVMGLLLLQKGLGLQDHSLLALLFLVLLPGPLTADVIMLLCKA